MGVCLKENGRTFVRSRLKWSGEYTSFGWFGEDNLGLNWRKLEDLWATSWWEAIWASRLSHWKPKSQKSLFLAPPVQPTHTQLHGRAQSCRGNFGILSFVLYGEGWCASFSHFFTSDFGAFSLEFWEVLRAWRLEETSSFNLWFLPYVWYNLFLFYLLEFRHARLN